MSYKINPDEKRIQDIEDLPLYAQKFIEKTKFQDGEQEKVEDMIEYLIKQNINDREKLMKKVIQASRIFKVMPSRSKLLRVYRNLVLKKNIKFDYDFMHLFGHVCLGYVWARMAQQAFRNSAQGTGDAAFNETKIKTGLYYMQRELPATALHLARIKSGADPVMALTADQF